MLGPRDHVCRTVLLEFMEVRFSWTYSNHFRFRRIITLWEFYSSSLPNPLKPLLFIRNYVCRTVLFEFRVVCLCWTYSNHCWLLQIMSAEQFSSSWKFVSPEPTQTTSVSEESSPSEIFTLVQGGSSLLNPLEPLLAPRDHVCRTVLLEFVEVRFSWTHSNHFHFRGIITLWEFYSSSG